MKERVLVLADSMDIFLAVARSLGRRGIEVHVAGADESAPALTSRYIAAQHRLPRYQADPRSWVEAVERLADAFGFRLIIPCSDSDLLLLHHHADEIGRERLAIPNPEAVENFTDKARTRALAARLDIPVAEGELIEADVTAGDLARRLSLPLLLKPRSSYALGSREMKTFAVLIGDLDSLERALSGEMAGRWLAERFFSGEGVGVSVLARKGTVLLAWQHRRLRTTSETGASSVRIGEPPDPTLLSHVTALAKATGLDGIAMFEFLSDPRSGACILVEVNARFWGSLPLAVAAGADFPASLWEMRFGSDDLPAAPGRVSIIKCNMTGELDRLALMLEGADSASAAIAHAPALLGFCLSLLRPARFDSWAIDDPEPFRRERQLALRRIASALTQRVNRGSSAALKMGPGSFR